MSDLIRLGYGARPWQPSPDAELVAEYQFYDIPLSGILRQGGLEYLFLCLDGAEANVSLWWYTQVTAERRQWLESAPDQQEFNRRLHVTDYEGWSRLAIATERGGIFDYEDVADEGGYLSSALKTLVERVDSVLGEAHDRHVAQSA